MIAPQVKIEHTRLFYSFYRKSSPLNIGFAVVIFLILLGQSNLVWLVIWLILAVAGAAMQQVLTRYYEASEKRNEVDFQRWYHYAIFVSFLLGLVLSMAPLLAAGPSNANYFMVSFFLVSKMTVISASGFNAVLMASAIPIIVVIGWTGYYHLDGYWYLPLMAVFGLITFYYMGQVFENTLLESIKIRFEKQALLRELELKKEEAEEANRAKSVFLASASHDLRQPLHALGLYLEMLKEAADPGDQSALEEKMSHSLDALNDLFDSLLDISKLDSGIVKPVIENFKFEELAARLISTYQPLATAKKLKFKHNISSNCVVKSDLLLLERVVGNLISNAIRYTTKGEVQFKCTPYDDSVLVEVNDSGIGIPNAEHENIFKEFYQLNNPERARVKGLGLGLSIVQRLCELLKHELKFESKCGKGSQFRLSVPLGDASKVIDFYSADSPTHGLAGLNILIIDNEEMVRDAISSTLARWGCKVESAASISGMLGILDREFMPDIIITDYRLQGSSNGLDVFKAAEKRLSQTLPGIIITGDTSPERIREACSAGHQLLHKPVSPGLLRETIKLLMRDV